MDTVNKKMIQNYKDLLDQVYNLQEENEHLRRELSDLKQNYREEYEKIYNELMILKKMLDSGGKQ
jgi:regulator of replication initiation timing